MNHFEKVCKSTAIAKAGKQKNNEVCQLNDELLTLNGVDNRRAYCHLNVDGQSVNFLLDCGATANVLPLDCAAAINPRLTNLRPARSKLRMFDNTELNLRRLGCSPPTFSTRSRESGVVWNSTSPKRTTALF